MGHFETFRDRDGNMMSNEFVPSIPDYFGPNTFYSVELLYVPQIGAFLIYEGKDYVVTQVTTYQEKPDKEVIVTHVMTCYETDEDGEIKPDSSGPITLKSTMSGITTP